MPRQEGAVLETVNGVVHRGRGGDRGEASSARAEADQEIEQSLVELNESLESARGGLQATAEELARQAAERILGRSLT